MVGLNLADVGTPECDWHQVKAVCQWSPPGSALRRAMDPEAAGWTLTDHLLALSVDAANTGNWQRGGGKGRRPKPLPRPGTGPKRTRFTGKPMSIDQARAWLDKQRG